MVYNENPLQLVGCLRWECASTGADRMGFWVPPGIVHRVPSAIEMCMQAVEKKEEDVIIIIDCLDMP